MSVVDDVLIRIHSLGGKAAAEDVATVEGGMRGMGETAKTVAGVAGIGAVAFGLRDVTEAAIKFQAQQALLANALKNTGQYSVENLHRVTDAADTLSQHGGYDPTVSIGGMQQLVTAHEKVGEAIKNETLVTDIGRAAHVNYLSALRVVENAEQGRITGLTRLGITLRPTTKAMDELTTAHQKQVLALQLTEAHEKGLTTAQKDRMASGIQITQSMRAQAKAQDENIDKTTVMTALWHKFGGATAAYSNTAAGAASNFRGAIDVLGQRVGTFLLPIITGFVKELSTMATWLNDNQKVVLGLGIAFGALAAVWGVQKIAAFVGWLEKSVVVTKAQAAATWLWQAAQDAVDAALLVANGELTVMEALEAAVLLPIIAIVGGLALLGVAIYEVITHWKDIKKVAIEVWDAIEHAVSVAVSAIAGFFSGIADDASKAFNAVIDAVKSAIAWIGDHWKTLLLIFLPVLGALIDIVVTHFAAIKRAIGAVIDWIVGAWRTLEGVFKAVFGWIYGNVIQPIVHFWSGVFTTLVSGIAGIWRGLQSIFKAVFDWIYNHVIEPGVKGFLTAVHWVVGKITAAWHGLTTPIKKVWDQIKKDMDVVLDAILKAVRWVVDHIVSLWHKITGPLRAIAGGIGAVAGGIGHAASGAFNFVTGGATGGYTPSGGQFEVGEHGREQVILPPASLIVPNSFSNTGMNSNSSTPLEATTIIQLDKTTFMRAITKTQAYAKATS